MDRARLRVTALGACVALLFACEPAGDPGADEGGRPDGAGSTHDSDPARPPVDAAADGPAPADADPVVLDAAAPEEDARRPATDAESPDAAIPGEPLRVVGYYASYATYRGVQVADLPAEHLTHLNYAFFGIEGGRCVLGDRWADVEQPLPGDPGDGAPGDGGNLGALRRLRAGHPDLRVLGSVGGWGRAQAFSEAAATVEGRRRLARSCADVVVQYGLDGIDVDWEFPVVGEGGAHRAGDREAFVALLAELRGALAEQAEASGRAEPHLLTIAVPVDASILGHFDLVGALPWVDWVNLMAYDMVGPWSAVTGFDAPLRDPADREVEDVEDSVARLLARGVPASRLVLGVPFYGRSFAGVPAGARSGLFEPFGGPGPGTFDDGVVEFRGLDALRSSPEYGEHRDETAGASWLYSASSRVFVTFEDVADVRAKRDLALRLGLGGLMAWELSQDDGERTLTRALAGR